MTAGDIPIGRGSNLGAWLNNRLGDDDRGALLFGEMTRIGSQSDQPGRLVRLGLWLRLNNSSIWLGSGDGQYLTVRDGEVRRARGAGGDGERHAERRGADGERRLTLLIGEFDGRFACLLEGGEDNWRLADGLRLSWRLADRLRLNWRRNDWALRLGLVG